MDFRHQITTVAGVAAVNADALLVVVIGNKAPADLPAALAQALQAVIKQGDLALDGARSLYVGALRGVKAPRVAFAVAADASARAVKSALAQGLALLKGLGAKQLAVWLSGAGALTEAHAEALASTAGDATYLYRHTKPSAGPASKLARIT